MLLKLAGIGKLFGARAVLRNISFEVHPGTVTLLVGANGAGKTTLLKIMAGLARPTVGTVERFCEDGGLGYLGHATFIYPGLTALENLAFWSGMHGNPTDKATLSEALARVELAPFAEERAGTFSRGMAQRLNLARILLQSPPLLLLDEPGTGLDVRSLAILHREIAASRDRGAGIVWITHDVAGDAKRADRIIAIENRTIGYCGPASGYEGVLKAACLIARKDLRLVLSRGAGLVQALLLGLLLIFVFSLSRETGETMSGQGAATIFWLSSAFCQVLSFNMLYGLEEANGSRAGLLLLPTPVQSVLLGKAAAGLCIILTAQFLFLPATTVFLGQSLGDGWPLALLALVLTDIGMASLGSLLGALSQGQAARESLLSIVLFPLIIPILLAGIRVCAGGFSEALPEGVESWLGIAVAFDAVFLAAGLVLFPFVFSGDE